MELDLDRAILTRASDAFNPFTGERVTADILRRASGHHRILKWKPNRIYRTFSPGMVRMTYAELLTRQATFEAAYAVGNDPVTVSNIGTSTNGRDIKLYQLGDPLKPAIIFLTGVHGNEVDGTEGMFALWEDLINEVHPDLSPILEQYQICWVPSCNPDGWFSNLRNLAGVGPNGQTVNLNRAFPFFWDPYVESSAESKGAAPAGTVLPVPEPEADAIFDWIQSFDPGQVVALFDHHQNIGQGHRYISRNRVNSFNSEDWHNRDFDILRVQGSIRKQRGPSENLFVQFRRSKNVPHLHSWASGAEGIMACALESRKDEPTGPSGSVEWVYDTSIACMITMTDAYWDEPDAFLIEQGATNLVTNQEWATWNIGNVKPEGFSKSRLAIVPNNTDTLLLHNDPRCVQATAELAVDPAEVTPDWQVLGLSDIALAIGRLPSTPGTLQTMKLSGETVATGPGGQFVSPTGATRRFGMVWKSAAIARAFGGWSEDGNTLYNTGFGVNALNGTSLGVEGNTLPNTLADMGYATDGSRYSVFVGGSTGIVSSPFVAALSNKILKYDATTDAWTDTTLTIPARIHACVVHEVGTDKFWIFGGEDASGVPFDTIYVYDVSANTVTLSATTFPYKLTRMAGCGWGTNRIYLYGGVREVTPGVYERISDIRRFVPSTEILTTETVLANIEDEASHDETPWSLAMSDHHAARRFEGDKGDIFLIGGVADVIATEYDQEEIYSHRPDSSTLTFARDGIYGLFSKLEDIAVTPGEWYSISTHARSVNTDSNAYIRVALTFKNASGGWSHHGRTYYEVPRADIWQWFRTSAPAKSGESLMRPYVRLYVDAEEILFERTMVSNRSRASSYHPTTRAPETLVFSESLKMNNLRLKFAWDPTFGFINVGEDLELARVSVDANNYISLVAMEGTADKTYHDGNDLVGPQYPQVELRKYRGGILEKTLTQTLYYGYDCRSSNIENYSDPVEFVIEHIANGRFGFGIWRYGILGWTEDRVETTAFSSDQGQLQIAGEGWYGIPQVEDAIITGGDAAVDAGVRELGNLGTNFGGPVEQDCMHPGEENAL